jgi:hypothetical protein
MEVTILTNSAVVEPKGPQPDTGHDLIHLVATKNPYFSSERIKKEQLLNSVAHGSVDG